MAVGRSRSKGVALNTVIQVVIGVGAVVLAYYIMTMGQQLADFIQKFIFGELSGTVLNTELKDAIECSYLRCTQGCAATEGISVRFPTGTLDCKDHCESAVKAEGITDGKLCGEAAQKHPLRIIIAEEDTYISTDDLKFEDVCKGGQTCCIYPSDNNDINIDSIAAIIKDSFVKKVDITEGRCESILGQYFPTSYCDDGARDCPTDTLTLNTGTYYIWTIKWETIAGYSIQNIIWDSYTEPIKSGNFVCCSNPLGWRDGMKCATGSALKDANSCNTTAADGTEACSSKCIHEGHPHSYYEVNAKRDGYRVCSCITVPGYSTSTTTAPEAESTTNPEWRD